jgi:hypothetical protein
MITIILIEFFNLFLIKRRVSRHQEKKSEKEKILFLKNK